MKKLVSTAGLDKKEWLLYRKQGIGGSDAGAICGLNSYRTAMQVYLDKTSEEVEEIDNEAMLQGRDFEDYVARRFMKATGIVRRIDDLGRVVIPKEIRRTMRIREGDPLQTTLTRWERFCFAMLDLSKRWRLDCT